MTTQGNQCGWGSIINVNVGPTLEKKYMHEPMQMNFKWQVSCSLGFEFEPEACKCSLGVGNNQTS